MIPCITALVLTACVNHNADRERARTYTEDSTSYTLNKILAVSPEKVYNVYLDPQSLKQIWDLDSIRVDAKPEGETRCYLKVDGRERNFTLIYKEIIPNQKLKWLTRFNERTKDQIVTTVVFNSVKEGTEISFCQEHFQTKAQRNQHKAAHSEALNKLSSLLVKL
jgi:uncharacterized protein YndB with AHSA1/START domain